MLAVEYFHHNLRLCNSIHSFYEPDAEHAGGRIHGAQDLIVECKNSLSTVAMVLPMKLVMSLALSLAAGWLGKNLRLVVVMMIDMSYPDAVIITFLSPSSTVANRGLADTTTLSLSDLASLMKSILTSRQGILFTLSVWPGLELVSQPQDMVTVITQKFCL